MGIHQLLNGALLVNMFRTLLLVSCLVLASFGGYVNHKKKAKSCSVVPFTDCVDVDVPHTEERTETKCRTVTKEKCNNVKETRHKDVCRTETSSKCHTEYDTVTNKKC